MSAAKLDDPATAVATTPPLPATLPSPPPDADGPARRSRDKKRRGADAVVALLADAGVRHVFGLPGGAIAPFVDALLDEPRIRPLVLRHEATAVFASCGYALATGSVGVVFVTSGPGATNAITGIASAFSDGVPLVVLIGEVPRAVQGRGALQDGSSYSTHLAGMLRHVTKATWEATDAHSLPHTVRRALHLASTGKKGPVAVVMPLDAQLGETIETRVAAQAACSASLDDAVMLDVVARIQKASRPAIFAGNGTRGAAAALRAFAEHTGIPVITTPKAKGVFPESHPLCRGIFGAGGHPSARRTLEEQVDCLLAVGTSFGDLATDGWSRDLYPTRNLIHVDIDGAALARNYAADVGIVASAELFFAELLRRLPALPTSPTSGVAGGRRSGVERQEDALSHPLSRPTEGGDVVSPARFLVELQRALPSDTIITVDSGEHTLHALHWLEVDRPDAFQSLIGFGSMGAATGLALGAAVARPERRVCAILGDGGFLMVGADIANAVALGLDITFVVMNDHALRMCELGHDNIFGRAPSFATPPVDVVQIARGLGAMSAARVTRAELPALAGRGVHFLDVQIDTGVSLPKRDRVAAMNAASRPGAR